jgi:hypothetical protein
MDCLLEKAIDSLGSSKTELNNENIKRMREELPIPREYKVLWADVVFSNRSSGIVFTDNALVIRADKETLMEQNKIIKDQNKAIKNKKDKKELQNSIYHFIKWEYFDIEELKIENIDGNMFIAYNNSRVLRTSKSKLIDFRKAYSDEYEKLIKISTTTTADVFASLEAVVAENFSKNNMDNFGHGQMAEEANTLLDKLAGKKAEVVGRDNAKNGPDRIVDGVNIQSKYCDSGKQCVNECFDKSTGQYRYYNNDGSPMVLEVPKDKYADAILEFRKKILEGKVKGVTNPDDASKYVKQGRLTYKQALNLCKPGTIESLTYDAATGVITCSFAFGLSFLATFVITWYQTGNKKTALNEALLAGIQVFGLSFFSHILVSQVARTNLTKSLIPMSSYIVQKIGYKATQTLVNAIRFLAGKKAISGAAAMKQLSKMLRSNVVTAAVSFVAFSIPDTYKFFSKKISSAQYKKNMLSLTGTMASAGAGTMTAALAVAKFGTDISPGVGKAIGFAGGFLGGIVGGTAFKVVGDTIREDDSVIMSRMFNGIVVNMVYEYLLQDAELDVITEELKNVEPKEFRKLFLKTYASDSQEKTISDFLRKYFENVIHRRTSVSLPSPDDIVLMLEDLSKLDTNSNNEYGEIDYQDSQN